MITTEEFAALPLDDQIATLEGVLGAGASADEALALCASVRDHAPLAWLCGWLVAHDGLLEAAARGRFAAFLLEQPETAVHRVVQAMLEAPERLEQLFRHLRFHGLMYRASQRPDGWTLQLDGPTSLLRLSTRLRQKHGD